MALERFMRPATTTDSRATALERASRSPEATSVDEFGPLLVITALRSRQIRPLPCNVYDLSTQSLT